MRVVRSLGLSAAALGGFMLAAPLHAGAVLMPSPTPCNSPSTTTSVSPTGGSGPQGTLVTFTIRVLESSACPIFGDPGASVGGQMTITDNTAVVADLPGYGTYWQSDYTNHAATLTWTYKFTVAGTHDMMFSYHNSASSPGPSGTSAGFSIYGSPYISGPTSSQNPAGFGTAVTFRAVVNWNGNPPSGSMMTFYDGSSVLGSSVIGSSGQAYLTTTSLTLGLHTITASAGSPANGTSVRSEKLLQTISPVSTPTPTPTPTTPPTATPAPTPPPTAAPTPTPSAIAPPGATNQPPPGAAPTSWSSTLHLSGADVPLIGTHPAGEMTAGMYDTAKVPPINALEAIAVSFGSPLSIWPWLLAIILGSCVGIVHARRNWLREEELEAVATALLTIASTEPTLWPEPS